MSAFDMPLDELRAYRPERTEPPDFDAVWSQTLAESRAPASALFAVGLMDGASPLSTVFAAYDHDAGPPATEAWSYDGYEVGQLPGQVRRYACLAHLEVAP